MIWYTMKGEVVLHILNTQWIFVPILDFAFLTGCAIGLNEKKGLLIGGHYVSIIKLPDWEVLEYEIPSNSVNNDQVLEVDITDMKKWNRSNVLLKKVK